MQKRNLIKLHVWLLMRYLVKDVLICGCYLPEEAGDPAITVGFPAPGGCRPRGPLGHNGECQGNAAAAA